MGRKEKEMKWSTLKRVADLAISEHTSDEEEVEVYVMYNGSKTQVLVTDIVMSHSEGKPCLLIDAKAKE